jgi:hypothetical protein
MTSTTKRISIVLCVAFLLGNLSLAVGGRHQCDGCGKECACRKVCHLKCEDKKVTVTMWAAKEEDQCIHGPGRIACEHCEKLGTEKDPDVPKAEPKKFHWTHWVPFKKPDLITTNKLMKRTITKSIPSYQWVVEDLCPECAANVQEKGSVKVKLTDSEAKTK